MEEINGLIELGKQRGKPRLMERETPESLNDSIRATTRVSAHKASHQIQHDMDPSLACACVHALIEALVLSLVNTGKPYGFSHSLHPRYPALTLGSGHASSIRTNPRLTMTQQTYVLTRENLKTPKAAAIAGMLFSVLTMVAFWLLWYSVPDDPQEPGLWLATNSNAVALGLNLVPFAGIAFLWFIGVLRDRLGEAEDRFFATVFFGSGLLFLGMLFTAAAMVGAILIGFNAQPKELVNSATFHFVRASAHTIMHNYMVKMAAVFMMTASTLAIYVRFAPRWLALLGYLLSLLLLFGSYYIRWSFVLFPLWVFLMSTHILRDNLLRR